MHAPALLLGTPETQKSHPPVSVGGVRQLPRRQGAFSHRRCFALGGTSNKPLDTDDRLFSILPYSLLAPFHITH